jgi:hypothetical protein
MESWRKLVSRVSSEEPFDGSFGVGVFKRLFEGIDVLDCFSRRVSLRRRREFEAVVTVK